MVDAKTYFIKFDRSIQRYLILLKIVFSYVWAQVRVFTLIQNCLSVYQTLFKQYSFAQKQDLTIGFVPLHLRQFQYYSWFIITCGANLRQLSLSSLNYLSK